MRPVRYYNIYCFSPDVITTRTAVDYIPHVIICTENVFDRFHAVNAIIVCAVVNLHSPVELLPTESRTYVYAYINEKRARKA